MQHYRSQEVFVTNLDTPAPEYETNKIEETYPPSVLKEGNYEPIPQKVNLPRVIGIVGKENHLPKSGKLPKKDLDETKWTQYFGSRENVAIICDFFWYGIARLIRAGEYKEIEKQLLDRIAFNYVQLLLSVEPCYRDAFFKNYYDSLAQSVFYSYFFAFPKSRTLITSEVFINRYFEILSKKITGIPVCNLSYEKWNFDLGSGNILKSKTKATNEFPGINKTRNTNKKLLHMKYSPLVDRYMRARKYEGLNLVKDWHLGFSLRNLNKQKKVEERMKNYRKLAYNAVANTKKNYKEYEALRDQVNAELRETKRHTAKVIKLINERTNEIKSQNKGEYANMLVSLKELWNKRQ